MSDFLHNENVAADMRDKARRLEVARISADIEANRSKTLGKAFEDARIETLREEYTASPDVLVPTDREIADFVVSDWDRRGVTIDRPDGEEVEAFRALIIFAVDKQRDARIARLKASVLAEYD